MLYHRCLAWFYIVTDILFDITMQITLGYFLAQRSKPDTMVTAKVINKRLRASILSSMLLAVLEHLKRKTFRLPQIIPTVEGREFEKS